MLHKPIHARQTGKRLANRLRLGVHAGLVLTHVTGRCVIEDISATGARLRLEVPPVKGQMAILQFHRLKLYGIVAWNRGELCGLRFDKPLPLEDMEGFLWISRHPEEYARFCAASGGQDWAMGLGD